MASSGFRITVDEISPRLRDMTPRLEAGLVGVMRMHDGNVQNYARQNAPWQDQTGNARNGLMAEAFKDDRGHGIVLFHTMPYGIWLETRWSGKYQIIEPTVQFYGPKVMQTVNKLLARI